MGVSILLTSVLRAWHVLPQLLMPLFVSHLLERSVNSGHYVLSWVCRGVTDAGLFG
jgi:hypothetical protein